MELRPSEVVQLSAMIERYRDAFKSNILPNTGEWENDGKVIRENGKIIIRTKSEVDAGYLSAVQPRMLMSILAYVSYLENELKKNQPESEIVENA